MTSFKEMQSELALYKNELKARNSQGAKFSRPDRPKAYAAVYTSSETDPDILDQESALSARARFDADAAHSREWIRSHADDAKSREFFDLPDNEEDY